MSIFKELSAGDVVTNKSSISQLVDLLNEDISGSATRRQYQVFVTSSGVGPGVTSSLWQTVFDQDFTLQTANPIFDVTFGFSTDSEIVNLTAPSIDSNGKYIFPSGSLMMREKLDIYRLMAQNLLGDATEKFTILTGSNNIEIKDALFIAFKRLFSRDQIKRETFAIRLSPSASLSALVNLKERSADYSPIKIYSDINASANKAYSFGGQTSTVVDADNTLNPVGLLFLDKGVLVLDMSRSLDQLVRIHGRIDAANSQGYEVVSASLKYFLASASMDDALDHICSTRFIGSVAVTSVTFQNLTNINSTLYFCRLGADEFNYSSNPSYVDSDNRIVVIDEGQEETQQSFTFVSGVGLYDASNNLLAVGKVSRPIFKDASRDLTIRGRLDY